MTAFRFTQSRQVFDELTGLLFESCWIQTTCLYYIYIGQSLHCSPFHSAKSHCLLKLSQKKTLKFNKSPRDMMGRQLFRGFCC